MAFEWLFGRKKKKDEKAKKYQLGLKKTRTGF